MELIQQNLTGGHMDLITSVVCLLLAAAFGAAGGAAGGIKLGGTYLGNKLSAMMGSTFGVIASLPGAILALIVLKLT